MTESLQVPLTAAQLEKIDRFMHSRGLASREEAAGLLIDLASDASAPLDQARALASRLREEGHATEADHLHQAASAHGLGHALLETLRETCQTILTTIEALDPKTQLLAEELRLEIDKRLLK